ncbi:Dynein heavy chain [Balamuthia mandrillaris]
MCLIVSTLNVLILRLGEVDVGDLVLVLHVRHLHVGQLDVSHLDGGQLDHRAGHHGDLDVGHLHALELEVVELDGPGGEAGDLDGLQLNLGELDGRKGNLGELDLCCSTMVSKEGEDKRGREGMQEAAGRVRAKNRQRNGKE